MQLQQERIREINFYFLKNCISISKSRVHITVKFELIWKIEMNVISQGLSTA